MNPKLVASIFAALEILMLAGQITTLISTYWTSWDLRFNWTESLHFRRTPQIEGQLVSEGHAGLWSRCIRVYGTGRDDSLPSVYTCLNNYNISSGSFRFTYGKACKTATAALCIGDAAVIFAILIMILISAFRKKRSHTLVRISLPLLLFQGLICFAIPLAYLSGNMAELIDHLTNAYDLLLVVRMNPWYKHDWAFWTQVGLIGIWTAAVAVFVIYYSLKYAESCPKATKVANGRREAAEDPELESLKS